MDVVILSPRNNRRQAIAAVYTKSIYFLYTNDEKEREHDG